MNSGTLCLSVCVGVCMKCDKLLNNYFENLVTSGMNMFAKCK